MPNRAGPVDARCGVNPGDRAIAELIRTLNQNGLTFSRRTQHAGGLELCDPILAGLAVA
jgi:hypothetical protein